MRRGEVLITLIACLAAGGCGIKSAEEADAYKRLQVRPISPEQKLLIDKMKQSKAPSGAQHAGLSAKP